MNASLEEIINKLCHKGRVTSIIEFWKLWEASTFINIIQKTLPASFPVKNIKESLD